MAFDFTSIIDRHGKDALALDALGTKDAPGAPKEGFDPIPMWVADMQFPTAPSVTKALKERIAHPLYGYYLPTREYYDAILRWQNIRNGVESLKDEQIGYENGVVGGVMTALFAVCEEKRPVLLHAPAYIGFTRALKNAGYPMIFSPLLRDAAGVWRMDLSDMEEKIKKHGIRAVIFCSPHNPTGRVWQEAELKDALEVFRRNDCVVISDEIWSDIVLSGHTHIPLQSVGEDARKRTVALYSPSKTFNLAGLIGSYHIIYDEALRKKVRDVSAVTHYNNMNVLSMHALIGAYSEDGMAWARALCHTIEANVEAALAFFTEHAKGIRIARPQGTYMLFADCTDYCDEHGMTIDALLKAGWDVGCAWQDGRPFGGDCTIRMNLALPKARLEEALSRLRDHVFIK